MVDDGVKKHEVIVMFGFQVFSSNTESAIPCPSQKSDVFISEINLFLRIEYCINELQYRDVTN
jgi:hypothetical protein